MLAMINGASVEKWVREKWGVQGAPPKLAKFARDMQMVRANVHVWFREVWDSAQGASSGRLLWSGTSMLILITSSAQRAWPTPLSS